MKKYFFIACLVVMGFLSLHTSVSAQSYAPGCPTDFFPTCGGSATYSCGSPTKCRPVGSAGCFSCTCSTVTIQGQSLSSVGPGGGVCTGTYSSNSCSYSYPYGFALFCGSGADSGAGTPSSGGTGQYLLSVSPTTRSVTKGSTAIYTVTVTPEPGMAGESVHLALTLGDCPTNATCAFTGGYTSGGIPQTSVTFETTNPSPKTATFTITTAASTITNTYSFRITSDVLLVAGPSVTGSLAVSAVSGNDPNLNVDVPTSGATISSVPYTTFGWAIDNIASSESVISSVKVYLDGVFIGNATYGSSRPDVCTAYGIRPGCPNVGWGYDWSPTVGQNGAHMLRFDATDSDATPKIKSVEIPVTVAIANPAPTVSIGSSAVSVNSGSPVTLSWSAIANATNCTSVGATTFPNGTWATAGSPSAAGNVSSGNLNPPNKSYQLSCTGTGGTTLSNVLNVTVIPASVSLTINTPPGGICSGSCTPTLSWSSTGAGVCSTSGGGTGWTSGSKGTSGSNVSGGLINTTTTFTITCGSATDSKTVTVNPSAYNLTLIKTGRGTVTSSPAGISCADTCSGGGMSKAAGTPIVLTASVTTPGRIFTGWRDSTNSWPCTESDRRSLTCSFTLNGAMTVYANFAVDPTVFREF